MANRFKLKIKGDGTVTDPITVWIVIGATSRTSRKKFSFERLTDSDLEISSACVSREEIDQQILHLKMQLDKIAREAKAKLSRQKNPNRDVCREWS